VAVGLCDRRTVDGLAYWPDTSRRLLADDADPRRGEGRYQIIIRLRALSGDQGYHTRPDPNRVHGTSRQRRQTFSRSMGESANRLEVTAGSDFAAKARGIEGCDAANTRDGPWLEDSTNSEMSSRLDSPCRS
jgi:hypothetical protein